MCTFVWEARFCCCHGKVSLKPESNFVSKCHVIMAVITLETLASAAITPPITLLRWRSSPKCPRAGSVRSYYFFCYFVGSTLLFHHTIAFWVSWLNFDFEYLYTLISSNYMWNIARHTDTVLLSHFTLYWRTTMIVVVLNCQVSRLTDLGHPLRMSSGWSCLVRSGTDTTKPNRTVYALLVI